jgi:membrane protein YqaA with SNARE-associated domain
MKKIKWYHKVNTWNKVIVWLSPVAGGEILALFANVPLPNYVHVIFGCIAAFVFYLKMFVKDENKDGVIDHFEK